MGAAHMRASKSGRRTARGKRVFGAAEAEGAPRRRFFGVLAGVRREDENGRGTHARKQERAPNCARQTRFWRCGGGRCAETPVLRCFGGGETRGRKWARHTCAQARAGAELRAANAFLALRRRKVRRDAGSSVFWRG